MADTVNQVNEREILEKLRKGDHVATEQLFKAYFPRLYSLVFNQVGKNREVAEDIVQETFLSAIKSASNFQGKSKIFTWLCSIAYHKVVDFYRRQGKEINHLNGDMNDSPWEEELAGENRLSVADLLESEESRQTVEKVLSQLPLDYRQVLILKYVEDMSVNEISETMQRSAKSIEGLLTRARSMLRHKLNAAGEGFREYERLTYKDASER